MGYWRTDWDCDVLQRIVILLFALANLADRAADAPFLRRRRVLGILNWGEVEARAFVIGMASGMPISADELEPTGDAAHLAMRLRALALLLCAMLADRFALPCAAGPRACQPLHDISGPAVRRPGIPEQLAPDTS